MTAQDAIRWIDEKKRNVYSLEDKLVWLTQVEQMAAELAIRHGGAAEVTELAPDTPLRIPAPYDGVYLRWLEAQMDYTNQEYAKYNNAMALFNTLWSEYVNRINRGSSRAVSSFRLGGGV